VNFADLIVWMLKGTGVTLTVAGYSLAIAVPFALIFGVLQFRFGGKARFAITGFIEFWRSSSVIILLFFFYYVCPAFGLRLSGYTVSALVIGCNIGAYGSQAVRSALASLSEGQVEAGRSLGLTRNQILFLVELPQALRKIVPIAGNETIEILKTTANVSLIGLADITFRAKEAMQVAYQPAEIYTGLILIYVAICLPVAIATRRIAGKMTAKR